MSNNNTIEWIEKAIDEKYFKLYEYKYFSNIIEIGSGGFGRVYRANWKNSTQFLALKYFFKLDDETVKEVVKELKLQREVDFHDNIIRFNGITKSDLENDLKKYLLVMEYADGGTLRKYLNKHFDSFNWDDKCGLAHQLVCAVLCLHDEEIIHRDLHSKNVLVHKNTIKLADFGLSKRIEESSSTQTNVFGMIPYADPKIFNRRASSDDPSQIYKLNKKSDVYSIGILLWEISSGHPPFNKEACDIGLAMSIFEGLREKPVPGTPEEYEKIYIDCWNLEPENRPTINRVVDRLNTIIRTDKITEELIIESPTRQESNTNSFNISSSIDGSLHGELTRVIQDFDKMNTEQMETFEETLTSNEKDFIKKVDELVDLIFKSTNNQKYTFDYNNNSNQKISLKELHNWLLNNQNDSNSIFLLGYFNYCGIEINQNNEEAFNLFLNASEKNHILSQYYVGLCYEFGYGIVKNLKLAFEYYEKIANKNCALGEFKIGYFSNNGIDVEQDTKLAIYWYERASNNGDIIAQYNCDSPF